MGEEVIPGGPMDSLPDMHADAPYTAFLLDYVSYLSLLLVKSAIFVTVFYKFTCMNKIGFYLHTSIFELIIAFFVKF